MKDKKIERRSIVICVAILFGLAVGIFKLGPAIADNAATPAYPVNDSGQTYGSDLFAASIETGPDLVAAEGVDGTFGYVQKKDLYEDGINTPEEALAAQKASNGKLRLIPLYAKDGKTVIGKFEISSGYCEEKRE